MHFIFLLFFKTFSGSSDLLLFYLNFRVCLSSSKINHIGVFIEITLNSQITVGRIIIFVMLKFSVQEYGVIWYVFLLCLSAMFQFNSYKSFTHSILYWLQKSLQFPYLNFEFFYCFYQFFILFSYVFWLNIIPSANNDNFAYSETFHYKNLGCSPEIKLFEDEEVYAQILCSDGGLS